MRPAYTHCLHSLPIYPTSLYIYTHCLHSRSIYSVSLYTHCIHSIRAYTRACMHCLYLLLTLTTTMCSLPTFSMLYTLCLHWNVERLYVYMAYMPTIHGYKLCTFNLYTPCVRTLRTLSSYTPRAYCLRTYYTPCIHFLLTLPACTPRLLPAYISVYTLPAYTHCFHSLRTLREHCLRR